MEIYSRRLPTIRQLQYFLAVCDECSFVKAANKLGVSQPPLSNQIKDLEGKLQVRLFLRTTQKVMLTEEGEVFRLKAKKILQELSLISELFKQDVVDKVILGMTKTLAFDFIPKFKGFITNFSDVTEIYKHSYTSRELLTELQKENVHLAFISDCHNTNSSDEQYLLVHQEPMVLVLPESHPSSGCDFVDLNDVTDLPLFWFARHLQPEFYDQCEQVFKKLIYPVVKRAELPDTLSMLLEVSLGKGILLLPQSVALAKIPGIVYKRLKPEHERSLLIDVFLVWKNSGGERAFINEIVDYFKAG